MCTVSLCMIVRDEEQVIGRCLDSVKDAVDEIIIVDTGSVDRTIETVKKYTDKIFFFPWQEDFSAARNFSFSKAGMDYCMWLDADDIVEKECAEMISRWKREENGSTDVVMMPYVAAADEAGVPVFSYYRERILKRNAGFLWEGAVHEAVSVRGKIQYLEGCVFHRKEKQGDAERNLRIYEKLLEKGKVLNPREQFYYGRELYEHGKYVEAVENLNKFLDFPEAFVENQVEACRIAGYCMYYLGKEQEALGFLLKGLSYCVPGGELCCDLGRHFFDRKRWEQAVFWYESALRAPKREREGGFFQKDYYGYIPCIQLSVCYWKLGNMERAAQYHKRAGEYKPYGQEYLKNRVYFKGM